MPIDMTTSGGAAGSPPLNYREMETTATADVARAAMKIVADTLDIPLLQVDQDTRKYQSSASRPSIPPLYTTRVATSYTAPPDESWRSVYQEMVNLLPNEFKELFLSALQLPPDQRNPNITILNDVMQGTAQLVNSLHSASTPIPAESPAAERTLENITQPYVALNTLASTSRELSNAGLAFLQLVGPNNANFDSIANALGQFVLIASNLTTASSLLADNSTAAAGKALIASGNAQIAALGDQIDRLGTGGQFLMLRNILNAAEITTAALLLNKPGAAALLIGLSNASFELNKADSPLGMIGPGYSALSNAIADGMQTIFLHDASAGEKQFSGSLIGATLLFSQFYGAIAYNNASPTNTQQETSKQEISETNYAHELNLTFLTASGALSTLGNLVASESGAGVSQQTPMAALLEAGILLMMITPGIRGGNLSSSSPLLNGISDQLQTDLATGIKALEGSDALSQSLKVYLQQAAIALENKDSDALLETLDNSLALTGATNDEFIGDVQDLNTTALSTVDSIAIGSNAAATTGISQAA